MTQDFLFGLVDDDPVSTDPTNTGRLVVAGLNIQGGSAKRLHQLMAWCGRTKAAVIGLSEVLGKNSPGVSAELRAAGYECVVAEGLGAEERGVLVAARPELSPRREASSPDGRWLRMGIDGPSGHLSITAIYAPTNGMSSESSVNRQRWQQAFLADLTSFPSPGLLIGDLNVLEPNHRPASPFYEAHDYAFYEGIVGRGYTDLYRQSSPDGLETSWSSPRFGGQRLDHAFAIGQTAANSHTTYDHSTAGTASDHSAVIVELTVSN